MAYSNALFKCVNRTLICSVLCFWISGIQYSDLSIWHIGLTTVSLALYSPSAQNAFQNNYLEKAFNELKSINATIVVIWLLWHFGTTSWHCLNAEDPVFTELLAVFTCKIISKGCRDFGSWTCSRTHRIKHQNAGSGNKIGIVSNYRTLGNRNIVRMFLFLDQFIQR